MEVLELLIIILIAVLLFIALYMISDQSKKLKRITRRYNNLLRGRGDLNMEELLSHISEDIDFTVDKVNDLDQVYRSMKDAFDDNANSIVSKLQTNIDDINSTLHNRIDGMESKYNSEIYNINETLSSTIENNKSETDKGIRDLSLKQSRDIEKITQSNQEFEEAITDTTERKLNTINDSLAFAVQKVALHKYDAFEHQTGHLSFTLVLLDRFNNGIMMTSINGRDASYTYSKNIKNGKPETEASIDEQEALNKVLSK